MMRSKDFTSADDGFVCLWWGAGEEDCCVDFLPRLLMMAVWASSGKWCKGVLGTCHWLEIVLYSMC